MIGHNGLYKAHLLLLRWGLEAEQKGTDGVKVDGPAPSVGPAPSQGQGEVSIPLTSSASKGGKHE